jgi:hypothetical protein
MYDARERASKEILHCWQTQVKSVFLFQIRAPSVIRARLWPPMVEFIFPPRLCVLALKLIFPSVFRVPPSAFKHVIFSPFWQFF